MWLVVLLSSEEVSAHVSRVTLLVIIIMSARSHHSSFIMSIITTSSHIQQQQPPPPAAAERWGEGGLWYVRYRIVRYVSYRTIHTIPRDRSMVYHRRRGRGDGEEEQTSDRRHVRRTFRAGTYSPVVTLEHRQLSFKFQSMVPYLHRYYLLPYHITLPFEFV